jgi:hypothetical protein
VLDDLLIWQYLLHIHICLIMFLMDLTLVYLNTTLFSIFYYFFYKLTVTRTTARLHLLSTPRISGVGHKGEKGKP